LAAAQQRIAELEREIGHSSWNSNFSGSLAARQRAALAE
jgi:hypothetical protein